MTNKTKHPAFNCIVFELQDNLMTLKSSDLERYVEVSYPIDYQGKALFGLTQKLKSIAGNLTGQLSITEEDKFVLISNGKTSYKFAKQDISNFPNFPTLRDAKHIATIPAHILQHGIKFVASILQATVNGMPSDVKIYFKSDKGQIDFVATNYATLKIATYNCPVDQNALVSIPFTQLSALLMLSPSANIDIFEDETFYAFTTDYIKMYIRKPYVEEIPYEKFAQIPASETVLLSPETVARMRQLLKITIIPTIEIQEDIRIFEDARDIEVEETLECSNNGFQKTGLFHSKDLLHLLEGFPTNNLVLYSAFQDALSLYNKDEAWDYYGAIAPQS